MHFGFFESQESVSWFGLLLSKAMTCLHLYLFPGSVVDVPFQILQTILWGYTLLWANPFWFFLNLKKVFNDLVCFLAKPWLVCTCMFFLKCCWCAFSDLANHFVRVPWILCKVPPSEYTFKNFKILKGLIDFWYP